MTFTCEVRVSGRLGRVLQAEFEELGFAAEHRPAETVLSGAIVDDAALYGLVRRIEALGLRLVELRRSPPPTHAEPDTAERIELPPT